MYSQVMLTVLVVLNVFKLTLDLVDRRRRARSATPPARNETDGPTLLRVVKPWRQAR